VNYLITNATIYRETVIVPCSTDLGDPLSSLPRKQLLHHFPDAKDSGIAKVMFSNSIVAAAVAKLQLLSYNVT
jgi:hypothetical protein